MDHEPRQPVPVLPLRDMVLFPGALACVQVLDLRHRALVREALATERMLALAVLKPGFEREPRGGPEFHALGCLARFDEVEWLPNDGFDVRVRGLVRVRFEAVAREFPYPAARVRVLPQAPYTEDDPLVTSERRALLDAWGRLEHEPLEPSLRAPADAATYEALVNAACMAVPATPEERLAWLALDSVLERGHRVRERMAHGPPPPPQPPRGDRN